MLQVPSSPKPQPPASEFRPGSTFAERYRIEGVLGAGPESTVYRAQDLLSSEAVALKLIGASARDNAVVSQYRLELNLLRQAHHRALVRIVDSGEYLGRLYVAMELVEGSTLREYLGGVRQIPIHQLGGFFVEMCDALEQVHAQHIIHRDIHPANIMITPSGAWKLMDFGIARDVLRKRGSAEYAYAAPEQLTGQPSSFAVDIYALGAVAYEMLTGRQPHPHRQAAQDPPLFLEAEIGGDPGGLANLIETCLHVDSAKRFQNVPALKTAGGQVFTFGHSAAKGRRLQELQMESAADPQEMTPLFALIVRALIRLHNTGRNHPELSPQNIWVNGESIVIENSSRISGTSPSQSTLLIADARYTAPELIMARSAPDQAAHACGDIYVLGFLFYELLAGKKAMRRQFAELEQMQTGLAWMRWHADPKLKLRPLAEVSPDCPKSVVELIEQMAEKDPSQRVRTLEEAAEALDRVNVRLAPTQSFAVSPPAVSHKRRRPATAVALTVVTAILMAGLIAGGWWFGSGRWRTLANRIPRFAMSGRASGPTSAAPAIVQTATGIMMLVPEGEFVMGDDSVPNEAPAHVVKLPVYYMDRLEVSNRSYREFCARTGHTAPAPPSWEPAYSAKDDYPVVNIGRDDAAAFCAFAGKRLPSEEEWEKAARGSEQPVVLWGNWTLPGLANLKGSGSDRPSAVGSFAADVSPFGVLDSAGNVQEWVAGEYKVHAGNAAAANLPASGQGIARGGSFRTPSEQLSPSWRQPMPVAAPNPQLESVGFRCAAGTPAALAVAIAREPASSNSLATLLRRSEKRN
jgi:serine/threonine protein kinase